jgi:hypothetical protein
MVVGHVGMEELSTDSDVPCPEDVTAPDVTGRVDVAARRRTVG